MKKLMLGFAMAAALVAAADVESPNIVGYGQNALQFGGTALTPQFVAIGGGDVNLQSLIPAGDDTSDNVQIQTLDAYGRTVDSYDWINWYGDNGDESCWVDGDVTKVTDVTFKAGQGLYVMGSDAGQAIQTAGEVGGSDVNVALQFGGTITGNPFPVSVNLQDIIPTGEDTSDNVQIQTIDAYGRTVDSYDWINWYGDNGDESCWVDGDVSKVTDVEFAPGQGLYVMGSDAGQGLQFPAPEL